MKKSELIAANREHISDVAKTKYAQVIRCAGSVEYKIYIWDDGEIETLECTSGSNTWLQAKDCESRSLHYVFTVKEPFFDWREVCYDTIPDECEDPDGYEAMKEDTEDWIISEYDPSEAIDLAIEDAEREESTRND